MFAEPPMTLLWSALWSPCRSRTQQSEPCSPPPQSPVVPLPAQGLRDPPLCQEPLGRTLPCPSLSPEPLAQRLAQNRCSIKVG